MTQSPSVPQFSSPIGRFFGITASRYEATDPSWELRNFPLQ